MKPFTPIGAAMLGTAVALIPGGVLVPKTHPKNFHARLQCKNSNWSFFK